MLLRPEARLGYSLTTAAFTYFIVIFSTTVVGDDLTDESNAVAYVVGRITFSVIGILILLLVELGIRPTVRVVPRRPAPARPVTAGRQYHSDQACAHAARTCKPPPYLAEPRA